MIVKFSPIISNLRIILEMLFDNYTELAARYKVMVIASDTAEDADYEVTRDGAGDLVLKVIIPTEHVTEETAQMVTDMMGKPVCCHGGHVMFRGPAHLRPLFSHNHAF